MQVATLTSTTSASSSAFQHASSAMPRILNYTPSWLSRPSMGFKIFSDPKPPKESQVARLVARQGSQIFVATQNNEIRWTDLVYLKDYEADARSRRATPNSEVSFPETLFRVSCSALLIALCLTKWQL